MNQAEKIKWSEKTIQRGIVMQMFKGALAIVPNCSWTGDECDLLIIDKSMRIIDVEIKISRADFKADAKKEKWLCRWDPKTDKIEDYGKRELLKPRSWPPKVWKHYYAMPRAIWDDSLLASMPNGSASGILLLDAHPRTGELMITCKKLCKCNRQADKITPEDALDIARLAALRMRETYRKMESLQDQINNNKTVAK